MDYMKYVALVCLIFQTVAVIFFMRISRRHQGNDNPILYFKSSAVVVSELMKLFVSLLIIWYEKGMSLKGLLQSLKTNVFNSWTSNLKMGIPGLLYVVQNNLLLIALSNLSGAVYHVTYQLKILVTAVLCVLIMEKKLLGVQWLSLFLLTAGVIFVQPIKGGELFSNNWSAVITGSGVVGLGAVILACFTSGIAGVFLEKLLKDNKTSIWERNIQLALYGVLFGYLGCLFGVDGSKMMSLGFLYGFNNVVWTVVSLQAIGGIIVAAVLKYADNILKCFGNSVSIIISCILSWYIGDYNLSITFILGSTMVIWSIIIYNFETLYPFSNLYSEIRLLIKRNRKKKFISKYREMRDKAVSSKILELVDDSEDVLPRGVPLFVVNSGV
ncbi:UDP-galactose transporter family protein [Cryptosporidium andersoni]|uniref:UDP-galactose transporter family protein n=1 Tax=Cryptosporidium andersoni TaxID=117008 RepID=A0A1J4MPE8_9CRYT|nr:UDP-galactose transporter family protein [Cryptosporidium andersoni]